MKNKQKTWLPKPKTLSEKGYRKFMARTKKIKLECSEETIEVTLQSVSPTWYYDVCKRYGLMSGTNKDFIKYMDEMFKNCVIYPGEIRNKGIEYFDERDDIVGAEELNKEISSFLRERTKPKRSDTTGEVAGTSVADGLSK